MVAPSEQDLETIFHRVKKAFVHRLWLSFDQEHAPLLQRLRENTDDLQCRIRVLHIGNAWVAIDYALVDFLGAHLKPLIYETSIEHEFSEDYSLLFRHNALRGNLKHLEFEVSTPTLWEFSTDKNQQN